MTINLSTTAHRLRIVTNAAVSTDITASFRDNVSGAQTPGSQTTNVATGTTVDIVSVPGASTQRLVDDVEISVTGSGSQQVKIIKDDGVGTFQLLNVLLGGNERAHFTNDMGWRCFDAFGREKGVTVGYSQLAAPTIFSTAGAYTYSVPVGATAVLIEIWGGGGQGGCSAASVAVSASVAAGGSAGGFVRKFLIGPPASITGTVGAAGSGAVSPNAGTAGGNTTAVAGALTVTATGGTGGTAGPTAAATVAETAAPAAVSGTNGDENITTESGGSAFRFSGTQALSGRGGISAIGNAGAAKCVQGAGNAGTGNASGGSGAALINGGAAVAGGAGTPGYARFTPYSG